MNPLVTCLCLTTHGRREFLARAIDCFVQQTYDNRELLIVSDSWATMQEVFDGPISRKACSVYRNWGNIGEKRNFGCQWARGEFIALWDDDDYYAPDRLVYQVEVLQASGKAVTGFKSCKFTDGRDWWQFAPGERPGFPIDSSVCFRRTWWQKHRFLEIVQVGAEMAFSGLAAEAGELIETPDLNLMYATIHKGNTSPRTLDRLHGFVPLTGFSWEKRGEYAAAG